MPEINAPYAPGTPCWVDLMVPDQQAALDFYKDVFGWQGEIGPPETGGYAMCMKKGRAVAGIGPSMDLTMPSVWTSYLASDNADATMAKITESGGAVTMPPMDVLNFGRMLVASDPAGAVFGVWQHKDFNGAQLVNEPGALTWNECNSRDASTAASFYSEAFGVGFEDVPQAAGYQTIMIDGRPVGGLQAMTDKDFPAGLPSHWSTYFSVDDTDSTVDAAVKRGANVLTPPKDTEFGRMASVSDPWGATFSIIGGEQPA